MVNELPRGIARHSNDQPMCTCVCWSAHQIVVVNLFEKMTNCSEICKALARGWPNCHTDTEFAARWEVQPRPQWKNNCKQVAGIFFGSLCSCCSNNFQQYRGVIHGMWIHTLGEGGRQIWCSKMSPVCCTTSYTRHRAASERHSGACTIRELVQPTRVWRAPTFLAQISVTPTWRLWLFWSQHDGLNIFLMIDANIFTTL